ncbi:hypothetical protein [Burkholderia sp. Tr-20390]|uniref:hypothetical protein n=1 Tax=Burkholderia sp. Tr-20390 TaxID=2703904 RepID=UPI0019825F0D|nr:hypothetical protein [Burkholderia sp. Tr-20390]MBN3733193.1 hypothetical protein [Burkholderia sp. Tr-20390]
MSDSDLSSQLRALARSPDRRSQTARLRDVLEDVEAAIAAGVRHEHILRTLHDGGFTFTMSGFKQALRRLRARNERPQTGREASSTLRTPDTRSEPPTRLHAASKGSKTIEQLAAERPDLSKHEIREMHARQYTTTSASSLSAQLRERGKGSA